MVMGHVSMDTSQGVADRLPLLSPLGCPQPPAVSARAVCELLCSPQQIPRPGAMQGTLAKPHCWSRLQAGTGLLLL